MITGPVVLDASAVLAYLMDEAGADKVAAALTSGASISAVNWGETLARLVIAGASPDDGPAAELVSGPAAPLEVVDFDEAQARETARIKAATTGTPLSLGDRACLALGRRTGRPVLTTDRAWRGLRLKIKVVLIR